MQFRLTEHGGGGEPMTSLLFKGHLYLFAFQKSLSFSVLQLDASAIAEHSAKFHFSATWTRSLVSTGWGDSNPASLLFSGENWKGMCTPTKHTHTHSFFPQPQIAIAARGLLRNRVLSQVLFGIKLPQTGKTTEEGEGHVKHRKVVYPTTNHSTQIT